MRGVLACNYIKQYVQSIDRLNTPSRIAAPLPSPTEDTFTLREGVHPQRQRLKLYSEVAWW